MLSTYLDTVQTEARVNGFESRRSRPRQGSSERSVGSQPARPERFFRNPGPVKRHRRRGPCRNTSTIANASAKQLPLRTEPDFEARKTEVIASSRSEQGPVSDTMFRPPDCVYADTGLLPCARWTTIAAAGINARPSAGGRHPGLRRPVAAGRSWWDEEAGLGVGGMGHPDGAGRPLPARPSRDTGLVDARGVRLNSEGRQAWRSGQSVGYVELHAVPL